MLVIEQDKAGVLCFVQTRPWDFREAAKQTLLILHCCILLTLQLRKPWL